MVPSVEQPLCPPISEWLGQLPSSTTRDVVTGSRTSYAIQRNAWKGNSAKLNFRFMEFSEVRFLALRRTSVALIPCGTSRVFEPVLVLLAVGHGGSFEGGGLLL
jgi:hypothetical protein